MPFLRAKLNYKNNASKTTLGQVEGDLLDITAEMKGCISSTNRERALNISAGACGHPSFPAKFGNRQVQGLWPTLAKKEVLFMGELCP